MATVAAMSRTGCHGTWAIVTRWRLLSRIPPRMAGAVSWRRRLTVYGIPWVFPSEPRPRRMSCAPVAVSVVLRNFSGSAADGVGVQLAPFPPNNERGWILSPRMYEGLPQPFAHVRRIRAGARQKHAVLQGLCSGEPAQGRYREQ